MAVDFSLRDVILFGLFLLVRDGIPWFMRTAFPMWNRVKTEQRRDMLQIQQAELSLRKEMAEKELQLKREIAERDAIIEGRNLQTVEAIAKNLDRLTDVVATNTLQLTAVGHELKSLKSETQAYFSEGRKAIKQIAVMAEKSKRKSAVR